MRYALALVMPAVLLGWGAGQTPLGVHPSSVSHPETDGDRSARDGLFDGNPQHAWNVLHRQFYSRTTQDGKVYDQESLEPLFVPGSKFLTERPA